MRQCLTAFLILVVSAAFLLTVNCRRNTGEFTIALDSDFGSLDFLGASGVQANAERLRTLMYNTLVRKSENFEYVGDLAKEVNSSFDGTQITFVLQQNVKFHDGKSFTSADAKYTLETLLKLNSPKANAFYETINGQRAAMITEIAAPDANTLTLKLARPALKNSVLSNLVAIPILPDGAQIPMDASKPDAAPAVGTGAYKFAAYNRANSTVELAANENYWEGAPAIKKIRVRVIADASAVQNELRAGGVQLAPMMSNLTPETLNSLRGNSSLQVQQFTGANIQYLSFNTSIAPFDKPEVRQAVAFAVNREEIINNLLKGQAKLANSILPETSWAYAANTKYDYNPEKAKQLLDAAGLKPDADGNRLPTPIKFKIRSGNSLTGQYAQVIQNQLKAVGLPIEIEPVESTVFTDQLKQGQYQMTSAIYVGGNHDPIYLRDLFASSKIGDSNRTRYNNADFDKTIAQAVNELDRAKAKQFYVQAQDIIARDVPLLPLWYPANMVVAAKQVGNIQVQPSADWYFVRNLTFAK